MKRWRPSPKSAATKPPPRMPTGSSRSSIVKVFKGYEKDYLKKNKSGKKMFFNSLVAIHVGVNAAIVFNYFLYWICKNEDDNRNYRDGYHWTYNSVSTLQRDYFPFLTERAIRCGIKILLDNKMIVKAPVNYNKHAYDKTSWYRMNDVKVKHILKISKKNLINPPD